VRPSREPGVGADDVRQGQAVGCRPLGFPRFSPLLFGSLTGADGLSGVRGSHAQDGTPAGDVVLCDLPYRTG
jgi:hypothetical protein